MMARWQPLASCAAPLLSLFLPLSLSCSCVALGSTKEARTNGDTACFYPPPLRRPLRNLDSPAARQSSPTSTPNPPTPKAAKAAKLDVDCVCLDCEDAVAINRKQEARESIVELLQRLSFGRSDVAVRINSPDSGACFLLLTDARAQLM